MNREWYVIPDFNHLEESLALAEEYPVAFEYNDFFEPSVYSDEREIKRRISIYKDCVRDRSKDTLHGAFYSISIDSKDMYVSEYSRKKMEQSMEIAQELGVKGVVFHSGLISGLNHKLYFDYWYETYEEWFRYLLEKYSELSIYLENTFEKEPGILLELKKRLQDENRFQLCLDYGHAVLSSANPEKWIAEWAGNIGHIHLNDNDLCADLHLVPGEGKVDFEACKHLLEKYQVDCPVLLEIQGVEQQRRALQYMDCLS